MGFCKNSLNEEVLTSTQIYVLSKLKKNITIFHLKIVIFYSCKNHCILNRCVTLVIILYPSHDAKTPVFGGFRLGPTRNSCAATQRLEISDLGSRGNVLSKKKKQRR